MPGAAGALLLFIPWFFFMWNITVAAVIPKVKFRTNQTLAGIIQQAAPELSFESFKTYKYQTFVSRAVGEMSPVYKPAIRWKNQLYFSVFGMSGTPSIVVGPGKQIYQREYLAEYCGRNTETFIPNAEAWVQQIRAMQDFYEARGKLFLYLITPSKLGVYGEIVPPTYPCPATEADRRDKLPLWHTFLDKAGIHYVDAATLIAQTRKTSPIAMFPRGGVHWNRLAAALGAQALTDAINRQAGRPILPPFTITWERSLDPDPKDRDVLDILNMMYPDKKYEVPVIRIHSEPVADCKPARITQVTGSFIFLLDDALAQTSCPPRISVWFYWDLKHFLYPGGTDVPLPVDPAERRESLLSNLDVLIYEENEAGIPGPPHGRRLMEFIAAEENRS